MSSSSKIINTKKPLQGKDAELAKQYQQKTDKQHILDNPDTYVGSIEEIESPSWILNKDDENDCIIEKHIKYIP